MEGFGPEGGIGADVDGSHVLPSLAVGLARIHPFGRNQHVGRHLEVRRRESEHRAPAARARYHGPVEHEATPERLGRPSEVPRRQRFPDRRRGHDAATDPQQQPYGITSECVDDQGTRFYLGQD